MGARDVRNDPTGKLDLRLSHQIRFYDKQDPPARRVKPIPISVVATVVHYAYQHDNSPDDITTIADMICLGFFFLCRPGEHTRTANNTPFALEDVILYRNQDSYTYENSQPEEFDNGVSVSLTFTTQKNGVKNEIIRNGMTGDPLICPVRAAARRLTYHKLHNSKPNTPLCSFYDNGVLHEIRSKHITLALRAGIKIAQAEGIKINIKPKEVDARSLRSGGATAMLCAKIDKDLTQLQGRWKSDAMIRYLHISAVPIVDKFARKMFKSGDFNFFPQLQQHYHGYAYSTDEPDPEDLPARKPPPDLNNEDVEDPPLLIDSPPSSKESSEDERSDSPSSDGKPPARPLPVSDLARNTRTSPTHDPGLTLNSSPDASYDESLRDSSSSHQRDATSTHASTSTITTRRSAHTRRSLFSESAATLDDPNDSTFYPSDSES